MAATLSMTGFGAASRENENYRVEVELRSVNNRFLKFTAKLPEELTAHQIDIEKWVRADISRGTVYCTVRMMIFGEAPSRINWNMVQQYYKECQNAIHRVPIADAVTIDTLLNLPGVIESRPKDIAPEYMNIVKTVVAEALAKLITMREREGEQLKKDCLDKTKEIAKILLEIKKLAPKVAEEYHAKLTERVNQLTAGSGANFGPEDFAKEVALFADRCSIVEEIDRLTSHLSQFENLQNEGGVIGRNLEFLVQEMLREANTMSAKTQNIELVRLVLDVKSGVDMLREQVANFE
ncbi:MAG: YicC/YloC family endoribonuclease [Planctomycetota bacterium]|jgi:uncharacterized protein (TIGR00255 family)